MCLKQTAEILFNVVFMNSFLLRIKNKSFNSIFIITRNNLSNWTRNRALLRVPCKHSINLEGLNH